MQAVPQYGVFECRKQYVLVDIMKRRKRHNEQVMQKARTKRILRSQRKRPDDIHINPEIFIKQYRSAQKSYSYFHNKEKRDKTLSDDSFALLHKLVLVVRIRGVKDISNKQKHILNRLKLRKVGVAMFVRGTPANLRMLNMVGNYVTWGQPTREIISELVYKKMHALVEGQRVQIKSNMQIEEYFKGELLCLEDIVREIFHLGPYFNAICQFIYPFKLTTAEGTLVSRLRKPVTKEGHWGYRGEDINAYVAEMI